MFLCLAGIYGTVYSKIVFCTPEELLEYAMIAIMFPVVGVYPGCAKAALIIAIASISFVGGAC